MLISVCAFLHIYDNLHNENNAAIAYSLREYIEVEKINKMMLVKNTVLNFVKKHNTHTNERKGMNRINLNTTK